jgi:sialidase-1
VAIKNDIVLELAPTADNPRNSEGSFVTLADGRIMFAYTRFTGGEGDHDNADIAVVYSSDSGATWTEPSILVPNPGEHNTMSVSFLRLQDNRIRPQGGRIALFYAVKNSIGEAEYGDCRPRMCVSADEGATWSEPRITIPTPGYYVVNNDRIVQLASGRLLIPAALHMTRRFETGAELQMDLRGIAMYFLSDDLGETWRESDTWWALPVHSGSGLQEPGVIERADGSLYGYCRTTAGRHYGHISSDGGETWSAPEPTDLVSPCSPLSIKRLPSTGDLLAVWNDTSGRFDVPPATTESWGRTPLVSAISDDEGATWKHHRLLEDDPTRGFCYTAIHVADTVGDTVLLGYCAGGEATGMVLNLLRMRRIDVGWFYGEDTT